MYFDTKTNKFVEKKVLLWLPQCIYSFLIFTDKGEKSAGSITYDLADFFNKRVYGTFPFIQRFNNAFPYKNVLLKTRKSKWKYITKSLLKADMTQWGKSIANSVKYRSHLKWTLRPATLWIFQKWISQKTKLQKNLIRLSNQKTTLK